MTSSTGPDHRDRTSVPSVSQRRSLVRRDPWKWVLWNVAFPLSAAAWGLLLFTLLRWLVG